jgi:hypothetical protein
LFSASTWSRCSLMRKRWWSRRLPRSASTSTSRGAFSPASSELDELLRIPFSGDQRVRRVRSCPECRCTLVSLMLASSSAFWMRCALRAASRTCALLGDGTVQCWGPMSSGSSAQDRRPWRPGRSRCPTSQA